MILNPSAISSHHLTYWRVSSLMLHKIKSTDTLGQDNIPAFSIEISIEFITTLLNLIRNSVDCVGLHHSLDLVSKWCIVNQLHFFQFKKVTLDRKLFFTSHIDNIVCRSYKWLDPVTCNTWDFVLISSLTSIYNAHI